jgi:oligoribonuclease NrnB/cAMP/cGMP phosphodiesterase (DHH superfamily)
LSFKAPALILTDSDNDGSGCRVLFQYFLGSKVRIIQTSASDVNHVLDEEARAVEQFSIIGFADLCCDEEHFTKFLAEKEQVFLWDHHPRAEVIQNSPDIHWDINRCSARIVYDWFGNYTSPVMERYVELVQIFDLWKDSHPDFREALDLNNLLFWYRRQKNYDPSHDRFVETQIEKIRFWDSWDYLDVEKKVIREEREKEAKYLKKALKDMKIREDSEGHRYAFFELPAKLSYVAHTILTQNPDLDFILAKSSFERDRNKFSLRSKNLPVNGIAQSFGGGGHKQAAGFLMTAEQYSDYIEGRTDLIYREYVDEKSPDQKEKLDT